MALTRDEIEARLEQLIEGSTLSEIIGALSDVCHKKAQQVSQDTRLARTWNASGSMLNTVAETSTVTNAGKP